MPWQGSTFRARVVKLNAQLLVGHTQAFTAQGSVGVAFCLAVADKGLTICLFASSINLTHSCALPS